MSKLKQKICISAPAKLNLNLNVFNKDSDGYHFLQSQICFINLCDFIFIKESKKTTIKQLVQKSNFILNDETILFKTINLFKDQFKWEKNYQINFIKNIPIGAGLGGGSADAAAMLIGLKYLYNKENLRKKISLKDILSLGFLIGSDVPSCIYSKSILVAGKGEKISFSKVTNNQKYLIIYPGINLSTKKVFSLFKKQKLVKYQIDKTLNKNSLILTASQIEPKIKEVLNHLKDLKNIRSYGMSGSGSTCFAIFSNTLDLKCALEQLTKSVNKKWFIWYGNKKEFGYNRILY